MTDKEVTLETMKTPKEVDDKYNEEWAEKLIWQYEKCSRSKILAWGFKLGYEDARKDSNTQTKAEIIEEVLERAKPILSATALNFLRLELKP